MSRATPPQRRRTAGRARQRCDAEAEDEGWAAVSNDLPAVLGLEHGSPLTIVLVEAARLAWAHPGATWRLEFDRLERTARSSPYGARLSAVKTLLGFARLGSGRRSLAALAGALALILSPYGRHPRIARRRLVTHVWARLTEGAAKPHLAPLAGLARRLADLDDRIDLRKTARRLLWIVRGDAPPPTAREGPVIRPDIVPVPVLIRPVLEITGETRRRRGHEYRVVRVNGREDELPEGQAKALAAELSGRKGQKDARTKLRRWLRAHDLPGSVSDIDVRGLAALTPSRQQTRSVPS